MRVNFHLQYNCIKLYICVILFFHVKYLLLKNILISRYRKFKYKTRFKHLIWNFFNVFRDRRIFQTKYLIITVKKDVIKPILYKVY